MGQGPRLVLAMTLAALFAASPRLARAEFVTVSYQSQPGDFVGQGQTFNFTYTPANTSLFSVQDSHYIGGTPSYISFALDGPVANPQNIFTLLDFSTAALGIPLQAGTYTDAQRAAFAAVGHPGLDVSFQNRGSNTLTGNFTINSISFVPDASHVLVLNSLDVNFEQHSEGNAPALFGHVVYERGDSVVATPEPSSLVMLGTGAVCLVGWAWRRRAR